MEYLNYNEINYLNKKDNMIYYDEKFKEVKFNKINKKNTIFYKIDIDKKEYDNVNIKEYILKKNKEDIFINGPSIFEHIKLNNKEIILFGDIHSNKIYQKGINFLNFLIYFINYFNNLDGEYLDFFSEHHFFKKETKKINGGGTSKTEQNKFHKGNYYYSDNKEKIYFIKSIYPLQIEDNQSNRINRFINIDYLLSNKLFFLILLSRYIYLECLNKRNSCKNFRYHTIDIRSYSSKKDIPFKFSKVNIFSFINYLNDQEFNKLNILSEFNLKDFEQIFLYIIGDNDNDNNLRKLFESINLNITKERINSKTEGLMDLENHNFIRSKIIKQTNKLDNIFFNKNDLINWFKEQIYINKKNFKFILKNKNNLVEKTLDKNEN